jgi:exodeoxyribonuclease VIII
MIKEYKPGIYDNISIAEYHGEGMRHIVSNTQLGRLDKCPANVHVPMKDTPAMQIGRAAHTYVLEGEETFLKEYAVIPKCTRSSKIWAGHQADNLKKTLIFEGDYANIVNIKNAVFSHPTASVYLQDGKSEQTVIWQDKETGILCKCRPDRNPGKQYRLLVDFKTSNDVSDYGFRRSIDKFGYARQGAFYTEGISKATNEEFNGFVLVATEPTPPHRTEVYVIDPDYIQRQSKEVHRLLRIEKECRDKGFYPHYQNAGATDVFTPNHLKDN